MAHHITLILNERYLQLIDSRLKQDQTSAIYNVQLNCIQDKYFDIAVYKNGDQILLELFEVPKDVDHVKFNYKMRNSIQNIMKKSSIMDACVQAALDVKFFSEFDRVMIYKFDTNYNGSVIVEEKNQNIGSYLGLYFPSDDIPAQARELYLWKTIIFLQVVIQKIRF